MVFHPVIELTCIDLSVIQILWTRGLYSHLGRWERGYDIHELQQEELELQGLIKMFSLFSLFKSYHLDPILDVQLHFVQQVLAVIFQT